VTVALFFSLDILDWGGGKSYNFMNSPSSTATATEIEDQIIKIIPGIGIHQAFIIGTPINKITEFLKLKLPKTQYTLKYSIKVPNIVIETANLTLRFCPKTQRLLTIEIRDFNAFELQYNDNIFSNIKITPTFILVYKLFGPTVPGVLDNKVYSLNYPGVTFEFPLMDSILPLKSGELPFLSREKTTPILSKIFIYHGEDPKTPLIRSIGPKDFYFEPVLIHRNHIEFTYHRDLISFDDTCQDVLIAIGSPDKTMKKLKGLEIHQTETTKDYFWNYFDLGLDILFNGYTHRVKKFVLHANQMGHYEMMKYQKANYRFCIYF
jgi:hypothetical protein